jgi:hypothetical protein
MWMPDLSEVPGIFDPGYPPFSPSDLAELRRITSAVVRAIEAGELDVSPGQYGCLYGTLALATALTEKKSEDINP